MTNQSLITTSPGSRESAAGDALIYRNAQEVQAMVVMAKQFPRDEERAIMRIRKSCGRLAIAEGAEYDFPRGDKRVIGLSIRLAEVLCQNWGNIDEGFDVIDSSPTESTVVAYCWDLETNFRSHRQFRVRHIRERRGEKGGNLLLTDPRDIAEHVANFSQRATRVCIQATIPRDVQDLAVEECRKTMMEADKRPTKEKIEALLLAFNGLGVTQEMLVSYLRHKLAATTDREILQLRRIFTAIKDGMGGVEDYFSSEVEKRPATASGQKQSKSQRMAETLREGKTSGVPATDQAPEVSGAQGGTAESSKAERAKSKKPEETPPESVKAATQLGAQIVAADREEIEKFRETVGGMAAGEQRDIYLKMIATREAELDKIETPDPPDVTESEKPADDDEIPW